MSFFLVSVKGVHRGLGDKYLIRMDELVTPIDRHVLVDERPPLFSRAIVRRKVKKTVTRPKRSPDGTRNTIHEEYNIKLHNGKCGVPAIQQDIPLYTTYIRNGTCTKYGAFPWTVQIQVNPSSRSKYRVSNKKSKEKTSDCHPLKELTKRTKSISLTASLSRNGYILGHPVYSTQ